jgi:hypothetical protein
MQATRHTGFHSARRRRYQPTRASLPLTLLAAGFAGIALSSAHAQVAAAAPQAAAPSADAIRQREQELEAARAQQKSATELQ